MEVMNPLVLKGVFPWQVFPLGLCWAPFDGYSRSQQLLCSRCKLLWAVSCSRLHLCFLATFYAIPRCHSGQAQINLWSDLSLLKWLHLPAEVLADHSHPVSSQCCPTLELSCPQAQNPDRFCPHHFLPVTIRATEISRACTAASVASILLL